MSKLPSVAAKRALMADTDHERLEMAVSREALIAEARRNAENEMRVALQEWPHGRVVTDTEITKGTIKLLMQSKAREFD